MILGGCPGLAVAKAEVGVCAAWSWIGTASGVLISTPSCRTTQHDARLHGATTVLGASEPSWSALAIDAGRVYALGRSAQEVLDQLADLDPRASWLCTSITRGRPGRRLCSVLASTRLTRAAAQTCCHRWGTTRSSEIAYHRRQSEGRAPLRVRDGWLRVNEMSLHELSVVSAAVGTRTLASLGDMNLPQ